MSRIRPDRRRLIVDGILWRLATGVPWRDPPERFGAWKTVYSRFRRWQRAGVWTQQWTTLRTLVELLADVSMRIHPLTDHDIDDMLIGLRGYPLLTGYRGSPPLDVLALKNVLVRVNALVEAVPEISEMDLNPVFVRLAGVSAVDARIRLSHRLRPAER